MSFLRAAFSEVRECPALVRAVPIDAPAVQPLPTKAMGPQRCAGTTTAQHRRAQMASKELLPQTSILG